QLGGDLMRDLADQSIRDRQDHHIDIGKRGIDIDTLNTQLFLQTLASRRTRLDMPDPEIRAEQVLRQANAHFSAGAEQCNFLVHENLPEFVTGLAVTSRKALVRGDYRRPWPDRALLRST